jgi:ubiquinone/menaquinone biosynthesis C-methylase UbiE
MPVRARIAPEMRWLDAGCGPGEVMRLMGAAVGPTGEVTGIDLDASIGAQSLPADGGAFRFHRIDLTSGDAIPGPPFDLVFARFLRIHMTDPVGVTRRRVDPPRNAGADARR